MENQNYQIARNIHYTQQLRVSRDINGVLVPGDIKFLEETNFPSIQLGLEF